MKRIDEMLAIIDNLFKVWSKEEFDALLLECGIKYYKGESEKEDFLYYFLFRKETGCYADVYIDLALYELVLQHKQEDFLYKEMLPFVLAIMQADSERMAV